MILVTGGAGYIGSHCVLALLEKGFEVVVFDNLSTGHIETVETLKKYGKLNFYQGDLVSSKALEELFKMYKIDSVIHFAGLSQVEESVKNPQKYYTNNVVGSENLLKAMVNNSVKKIVFSSSAAVYGEPNYIPINENHPLSPINPYGQSKFEIEKMLDEYDNSYGLKSVRLRYFNVVGADKKCRIGEWHEPETHLIPNILKSTFGNEKVFKMFGTDYETIDGTCVRDYIDIEDLIQAHLFALDYLNNGGKTDCFNLGTQSGKSVKEVFETCKKVTGKNIFVEICPRRNGDPAILVADNAKAQEVLGWTPQQSFDNSIKNAYEWEKIRSFG